MGIMKLIGIMIALRLFGMVVFIVLRIIIMGIIDSHTIEQIDILLIIEGIEILI